MMREGKRGEKCLSGMQLTAGRSKRGDEKRKGSVGEGREEEGGGRRDTQLIPCGLHPN
jgi:hypothetical protein